VTGSVRSALTPLAQLVIFVIRRTFVEPVREGHLRSRGWPTGLGPIVVVALVAYVVLMGAAVFSRALRAHSPLLFSPPDQTLPAVAFALIGLTMILALSCLFTAGLHLRIPLRIAITVFVVAVLVHSVDWSDLAAGDPAVLGLAALLPVLTVVRWHRRFHWWEFLVALLVIGLAVVLHFVVSLAELTAVVPDIQLSQLTQLTQPAWALAAPVSILAGVALVEITTSASTWTISGVWERTGRRPHARRWAALLLGALVVARAAQEVVRLTSRTEPVRASQLLIGAAVMVVVFTAGAATAVLADRVPGGDPAQRPDPDELLDPWARWAPVLAVLLAAGVSLPVLVAYLLRSFGMPSASRLVLNAGGANWTLYAAATTAAAVIVAAVVLSRRGWRRSGLLLMTFGMMFAAASTLETLRLITTTDDILLAVSVATIALLIWLSVTGRVTTQAEIALAGVLLLGIAYQYRDWLNEPLTRLVSLGGVSAALLVGLVWRVLTDNAFTRGDSPTFPQSSRVLLALANALVGVTFAAQVALLGGRSDLDFNTTEHLGDTTLGFPLVLAVMLSGLALAARGRTVRGAPPPLAGTAD
jgi:hypothetical protein